MGLWGLNSFALGIRSHCRTGEVFFFRFARRNAPCLKIGKSPHDLELELEFIIMGPFNALRILKMPCRK